MSIGLNSVMFWNESGQPKGKGFSIDDENFKFWEVADRSKGAQVHIVSDTVTAQTEGKEETRVVQNKIIQVMTNSPSIYVLDLTKRSQECKMIEFDILDSTLIGENFLALLPKPAENKKNSDIFIYDVTNPNFVEQGPIRTVQTELDITNLQAFPSDDLVLQIKLKKKDRFNLDRDAVEMQIFHFELVKDPNAELKLTGKIEGPFDPNLLPTINEIGNLVFGDEDQHFLAAYDMRLQKMNDDYRIPLPHSCRSILSTNIGICMTGLDIEVLEFASLGNLARRAQIAQALTSHGHPIFDQSGKNQIVDIIADYAGGTAQSILPNATDIILKLNKLIRSISGGHAIVHKFSDTWDALESLIKDVSTEKYPTYSDCIKAYPCLGEILNKNEYSLSHHEKGIVSLLKEMQGMDSQLKLGKSS